MGTFKDLEIFKLATSLVKSVYQLTDSFPKSEIHSLTNQIKRAVVSIPSNIAESTGRRTVKERRYFIDIALGSLNELQAQLIIANKLNYCTSDKLDNAEQFIHNFRIKLFAYYKSSKPAHSIINLLTPNLQRPTVNIHDCR